MYEYSYFTLALLLLILWFALFFWRPDLRSKMFFMSLPLGIFGTFLELIYRADWWASPSIFGFPVNPESFLYGFSLAGIAAVLYEEVFKKRIKPRKLSRSENSRKHVNFWILSVCFATGHLLLFYGLHFNSLASTLVMFGGALAVVWIRRPDLIVDSVASGILLVFVSALVYGLVNFITPGWIDALWYFHFFPDKVAILGYPLEEVFFYFFFGAVVGPFYEFWEEAKVVRRNNQAD